MKKIKTRFIALMLIVAVALTGCMSQESTFTINPDGSGVLTTKSTVDKAELERINREQMKKEGMYTDAEIEEAIVESEKSLLESGYKLVTIEGKEYYQMIESQKIKKGDLVKEFIDIDSSAYATGDTVYFKMDPTKDTDVNEMKASFEAMGYDNIEDAYKMTLILSFSKPVVKTTGTIDASNPNKVSFDIPLDKTTVVFATTKSGVTIDTTKAEVAKLNTVKAPKIKKLKANKVKKNAKKATATLKIRKVKDAKKYEIQYSLKKNFKKAVTKTTKKSTYTIKKLKKGKKYYVRVRACKTNYAGITVYSKWSKKTVKTKK